MAIKRNWSKTALIQRIIGAIELQSNRNTHRRPVMLRHGETPPKREGERWREEEKELGF